MSLRRIPELSISADASPNLESGFAPGVLDRWQPGVQAAEAGADNVISIYEAIGEDPWTGGGVTTKRVAAALRQIGPRPVSVNINSPGGDVFEGVSIYNLLRAHPESITVRVFGLAASAASIIAMAGDRVEIARSGFLMIHNAWVMAMGNRNDLRAVADVLESIDTSMAGVYAAHTGGKIGDITALMDKESFISGAKAVEQKFADDFLPADQVKEDAKALADAAPQLALRKIDLALARNGMARAERRDLIKQFANGKPGAAVTEPGDTPRAVVPVDKPGAVDTAFLAACARATETLKTRP